MKHLYLSILFLLSFGQLFAQKDFRPGYIIQNGDTLRGQVDYRGLARSAKITAFKTNPEATEQSFTPDQLSGFGFYQEGTRYESKLMPPTATQTEQRMFLQVLVQGKASLYMTRDETDLDHFYLSKDGGPIVELSQQVYDKPDPKTGKIYRMVDKPFQGVLAAAFADCPDMSEKKLNSLNLLASSLSQTVSAYNTCMGAEQYIREPRKAVATFYPVLVWAAPTLSMYGSHMYAKGEYRHTGLGLGAGLGMEVFTPSLSEKLSLVMELRYAPYRFEGEVKDQYAYGRNANWSLMFDVNYIKVPGQLRYTFPKGKVRPFVNAGVSYAYAIHAKRTERQSSTFHGTTSGHEREALPGDDFKSHVFGSLAGAGILYPIGDKALVLEGRYESSAGVSQLLSLGSKITAATLLVGYKF